MSTPVANGLSIEEQPGGLVISHASGPLLRYSIDERYRPHVHPLFAPGTDRPLTRFRPADHPWQYGAYVALNDVNGQDFWCCGDAFYPPETRGAVRNRCVEPDAATSGSVGLTVANDWIAAAGRLLAEERQRWAVGTVGDSSYTVDVTWELDALDEPLRIGRYDYGGLALRLIGEPETRRLHDSEGRRDGECQGERARWVSAAQPVDGVGSYVRDADDLLAYAYAGVAVFDHPDNAAAPARWRLDGALLNPTPQADGPIEIATGESIAFRYRLLVFLGTGDPVAVDRAYEAWLA